MECACGVRDGFKEGNRPEEKLLESLLVDVFAERAVLIDSRQREDIAPLSRDSGVSRIAAVWEGGDAGAYAWDVPKTFVMMNRFSGSP